MVKFSICNEMFAGWSLREVAELAAALGYRGIEIAPFTLAESVCDVPMAERRRIRAVVEGAGLEVVGLHWLLVKPRGLHLNHPGDAVRRRTVDYLKALIDFCADVGGTVMVFGSPAQRRVLPGLAREQAWEYAVRAFRECGLAAQDRGITLCLEALPPDQTNFLNTTEEAISMVRSVGNPNVQMALDVKSMCSEDGAIPDMIRSSSAHLKHFHANDANLNGPGFGDVDFVPVFRALREVGYQGFVSVEVFDCKPDPRTVAGGSLKYMRECLVRADDES